MTDRPLDSVVVPVFNSAALIPACQAALSPLAANFGQHAAFTAGFEHAGGRYLVTLDVDLLCDPSDIPRLIEPLTRGYDLMSGVRLNRQDPTAASVLETPGARR